MAVGFTGTQEPLTSIQEARLREWMYATLSNRNIGHHGDCIGADAAFHQICQRIGMRVFGHIPSNDSKRAFCEFDQQAEPLPYLERNKNIVKSTTHLLACPSGPEKLRSGTWSTIRYARSLGRPVVIFWPDGSVTKENMHK